jgi:two-component system, NtrC family, response regulator HydG
MVVIDTDGLLDADDLPLELMEGELAATAAAASAPQEPAHLVGQPLSEIERWAIQQTLQLTGGNREETARVLGIGARTLYRKLKEYGIQDRS